MDSGKGWLTIAPVAGAIARLSGRGEYPRFLLEHGILLAAPRCAACGIAFDSPRQTGERFRATLKVLDARGGGADDAPSMWMFVGHKVLVARASPQLNLLLNSSIIYVGARVMVASVRIGTGHYPRIVLCRECGHNVDIHRSLDSEPSYVWDWLVELQPRRFFRRWGNRLIGRSGSLRRLQMRAIAHAH